MFVSLLVWYNYVGLHEDNNTQSCYLTCNTIRKLKLVRNHCKIEDSFAKV
jgi:hypothetical protein